MSTTAWRVDADVDHERNEVVVNFAGRHRSWHRVRLPSPYVDAHLEHGYALTDYGVQGRTLSRALAVLEEASTSPGSYVATTRGRYENRLSIATRDALDYDNLDTSHGIPRIPSLSLQDLTKSVADRIPEGMLHDRDPVVRAAAELAARTDEASLLAMLRELDGDLAAIPGDQSDALRSAFVARERLASAVEQANDSAASKETRQLARLDGSIRRLRHRQKQRTDALARRETDAAQRSLVADALALRRTKDRLALEVGRAGSSAARPGT